MKVIQLMHGGSEICIDRSANNPNGCFLELATRHPEPHGDSKRYMATHLTFNEASTLRDAIDAHIG